MAAMHKKYKTNAGKVKTYCVYYKSCKDGSVCSKAYTEAVKKELSSRPLKIARSLYVNEPPCFVNININNGEKNGRAKK